MSVTLPDPDVGVTLSQLPPLNVDATAVNEFAEPSEKLCEGIGDPGVPVKVSDGTMVSVIGTSIFDGEPCANDTVTVPEYTPTANPVVVTDIVKLPFPLKVLLGAESQLPPLDADVATDHEFGAVVPGTGVTPIESVSGPDVLVTDRLKDIEEVLS